MSDLLEPPRWPNGPPICLQENLPAFESLDAAALFHEEHSPGTHNETPFLCEFCGLFHYLSTARGPAGESNGSARYHKHKWKRH